VALVAASGWLGACAGTTSDDSTSDGGAGGSPAGGSGGVHIGGDGGPWPDGGGATNAGGAGAGGSGSGAAGGAGGAGGAGAGGSGVGGGMGGAGGSGGSSASGGASSSETCNGKDDNGNGQVDEGLSKPCATTCGTGTETCSAGSWGGCSAPQPKTCLNYSTCQNESACSCAAAPTESCNLKDDDCDGACDDGASCRVGIHRSAKSGQHFYTSSLSEASCCGFTLELQNFFYLYSAATPGVVAFYRCLLANGRHFYTTSSSCEGTASTVEGIMGYIASSATCGAVPLYRLSHPSASHFYTTDVGEKNNAVSSLGYVDEGIAGYVWKSP